MSPVKLGGWCVRMRLGGVSGRGWADGVPRKGWAERGGWCVQMRLGGWRVGKGRADGVSGKAERMVCPDEAGRMECPREAGADRKSFRIFRQKGIDLFFKM